MEIVKNKFKILDNMIVVELDGEDIQDNYQYEIRLKNFRSLDGKSTLDGYSCKVVTALSPAYCNISDVAVLVDTFEIPETTILYYIREASKYVDYIMSANSLSGSTSSSSTEVTFPMREFVKTKTMIDCLLKAFVNKAAGSGIKGTLGVISFENTEKYATSIDDLLNFLKAQLKGWEDALKGYELEGRAAPVYAVKAHKASSQDSTVFSDIVDSMDRELPLT